MKATLAWLTLAGACMLAACSVEDEAAGRAPRAHLGSDAEADAGPSNRADLDGAPPATDASPQASIDADAAHAGKVPIFVAQGSVGRTTISCDDGRTWIADRAWDSEGDPLMCGLQQSASCYGGDCSYLVGGSCVQRQCCNDTPDVAKGVVFGDGTFVATWGWGAPGAIRSSRDGVTWTTTHPNDSFGGVAYGGGSFVAASRTPFTSADGVTWKPGGAADFRNGDGTTMWSVRRFAYADTAQGGRFVAVASGNASRDMLISSDAGASWWRPDVLPSDCATEVSTYGGIVSGNGVIVIVSEDASACRSTDGGKTWSVHPTGLGQILSHGVFTGSEFWFWGDDSTLVKSTDGATWTKVPMTTPLRLGPVARSDGGTLVAVANVWQGYDAEQFYRSTDGLTWDALPKSAFASSHPIFYLTFGYADPSAVCPGRMQ